MSGILLGAASGAGVAKPAIQNSLRFRASASAYLSRTQSAPTDGKKFTLSMWVKRGALQGAGSMGIIGTSGGDYIDFNNDSLEIRQLSGGGGRKITTAVFRDVSAFLHVHFQVDTTDATAGNRIKIYINNVQQTSFSLSSDPSQNSTWTFNSNVAVRLFNEFSTYFDGIAAQVCFVDGQALTPSSFGANDATTGVWKPLSAAAIRTNVGTWGTNGFMLLFNDATSTTTLGYDRQVSDTDSSKNNWTCNNISVTAGVTYDAMIDSPVNAKSDTQPVGNYCTLNPLRVADNTLSAANLRATMVTSGAKSSCSTLLTPTTGKWYFEATLVSLAGSPGNPVLGIMAESSINYAGFSSNSYGYQSNGNKINNDTATAYGATYTANDVIGVALDLDAGTLVFYKNNSSQGTAYSSLAGSFFFAIGKTGTSITGDWDTNFGQRPFAYTPPSGYKALCTANLPTPTIVQPANHFNIKLRSGTGSSTNITGFAFQPDLVWVKARSAATDHKLTDAVRGVTKALISDTTGAETTDTNGLTAFNSDGYTIGSDTVYNNSTGPVTYVDWFWKANGAGSSNTSGTITSTVSANTTAGFSIVTYTGTGANATVGHGLGVAPSMVIVKDRTAASTNNWAVWHTSLTSNVYYVLLNSTAAQASGATYWNSTTPTTSLFSIGTANDTNANAHTYVAYCFAPIAGFSAFGKYTGNASTDGPFVYCGFRPRYVFVRRIDSGNWWLTWDSARNTYNASTQNYLQLESSNAENNNGASPIDPMDGLSNGFKIKDSGAATNASGGTYIYAAFSESPFNYSNAR